MSKIPKLEQQWMRYKSKKVVSLLLFFSILYALSAGGYYTFLNWNSIESFFSKKSLSEELNVSSVQEEKSIEKESIKEENVSQEQVSQEKTSEEESSVETIEEFLIPIIPIIDMEKERVRHSKSVGYKEKTHSTGVKAKPSTYLTAQELSKHKPIERHSSERDTTRLKKIHLSSSSLNYIETMKRKFIKTKNPRDALLLAKAFYRERNYKESEKWALEANKINPDLEESWIVFAQSKAKMGKKNEAIKILGTYYQKHKSLKLRALIENIKTGKL
jgi:tetratricopeptide (TPR) repeat protein